MKKAFHVSIIAISFLTGTLSALAAPSGFELEPDDLRSGSVISPHVRKKEYRQVKSAATAAASKETSNYIVQSGDHLFLILMRHYGLSNNAAERLVPEVMSINNIRNPLALTRGQRLTIPLPARPERVARTKTIAADQPPAAEPVVKPQQLSPSAEQATQGVQLTAASSCILGKEFAEKFNLLVPSPGIIQGFPNFTAGHAGLTVAVVCGGLAPEEIYTYTQLLAQHGIQLLVFADEEPHRRVIEKIANYLSLTYQLDENTEGNQLPLKVLFPAAGPGGREMRLTVMATASGEGRTSRREQ